MTIGIDPCPFQVTGQGRGTGLGIEQGISAGHVPGLPGTGTEQEHERVPDLVLEHDFLEHMFQKIKVKSAMSVLALFKNVRMYGTRRAQGLAMVVQNRGRMGKRQGKKSEINYF